MKKQIAACALIAASGCATGTVDGPEPTGDDGSGTTGGTSGSYGSAAPQRVGDVREVDIDLAPDLAAGESKTLEISEPGATFVKVRFASLNLDPGDQVSIADPSGDVVHRIDHSGEELWGLSVMGDTALVTIQAGDAPSRSHFTIDRIGAGTVDLDAPKDGAFSICGTDDKEAAACFEGGVADASRSVARMLFSTGTGMSACTGSLVSPEGHFLTNNHCVDDQSSVDSIEVQFNYQTVACGSDEEAEVTQVDGGTFLKTSQPLDYTLIKLPAELTENFGHLELDASDVPSGTEIFIPQHPGARLKEISTVDSESGENCQVEGTNMSIPGYGDSANVGYNCDTEGGSSGSPVISRDTGKVVALHHLGGCDNHGTYIRDIYPEIEEFVAGGDGGGGDGGGGDGGGGDGGGDAGDLANGEPVTGLSGAADSEQFFALDVPADAENLTFEISGGSGDADLYVRHGSQPTQNEYDYRPYQFGNDETVEASPATEGTWHVMIRGYEAYADLSLVASYDEGGSGGGGGGGAPALANGEPVSGLSGSRSSEQVFALEVPAGADNLTFEMSGGSGDADLYVRHGAEPTQDQYDYRPYEWGNDETVAASPATEGTWYVMVRGYRDYDGVSLVGSFD